MAAIVPVLANVSQSGDRSFSISFTSAGTTDTLSIAAVGALLEVGSSVREFCESAPTLASFRTEGAAPSLVSSVVGSAVVFAAGNFSGFAAGDHVLRLSLSYSASA